MAETEQLRQIIDAWTDEDSFEKRVNVLEKFIVDHVLDVSSSCVIVDCFADESINEFIYFLLFVRFGSESTKGTIPSPSSSWDKGARGHLIGSKAEKILDM